MQGDFSHKSIVGGVGFFFFTLLLLQLESCTDLQILCAPMGLYLLRDI